MRPTFAGICFLILSLNIGCGGEQDPVSGVAQEVVSCPGPTTLEGIDVSQYQGSINWNAVKGSGRAFAIARVGDGMLLDPDFPGNWNGMKSAGLVRGAYQFFRADEDPTAQANLLLGQIGTLGSGDLPPMLDVEVTDGQSPATMSSRIQTWLARVAAVTGRTPMIYTGKPFWEGSVGLSIPNNPLVLAAWVTGCPNTPNQWNHWTFWQYADNGSVPGISGAVDLDKFNGTEADLQNLAGGPEWAAQFVSQSFPYAVTPMTMTAGQRLGAYIEMRNTGTRTWDGNTKIGTTQPRDRQSPFYDAATWLGPNRLAAVKGTVPPGGTYRFAFDFHAPAAPGNYHEFFGMVEEGVHWFSDPGEGGPPDNQLEAQINVDPAPPSHDMRQHEPDLRGHESADGGKDKDGGTESDGGTETPKGGCSCQVAGHGEKHPSNSLSLLLFGGIGAFLLRRRRATGAILRECASCTPCSGSTTLTSPCASTPSCSG